MKRSPRRATNAGSVEAIITQPRTAYPLNRIVPEGRLSLLNKYLELCYDLRDKVGAAAFSRTIRTPETKPDDPVITDPGDYAASALFDAWGEANNLLHHLEEEVKPEHFDERPDELGEWLERIIHCKYELENAFIWHESDLEDTLRSKRGAA
jgi:hypothetical protein